MQKFDPFERINIIDSINFLEKIGDVSDFNKTSNLESISQYILKIKERLITNKSSISINPDIDLYY